MAVAVQAGARQRGLGTPLAPSPRLPVRSSPIVAPGRERWHRIRSQQPVAASGTVRSTITGASCGESSLRDLKYFEGNLTLTRRFRGSKSRWTTTGALDGSPCRHQRPGRLAGALRCSTRASNVSPVGGLVSSARWTDRLLRGCDTTPVAVSCRPATWHGCPLLGAPGPPQARRSLLSPCDSGTPAANRCCATWGGVDLSHVMNERRGPPRRCRVCRVSRRRASGADCYSMTNHQFRYCT
jgi:hypothetical protein